MRIGQLAKQTGASVRSLRHYENTGLIAARRRDNGYRDFDATAVERVRRIRRFLANGFTIDDIRPLSPCLDASVSEAEACEGAVAIYRAKLDELDARIGELQAMRLRIVDGLERLRRAAEGSPRPTGSALRMPRRLS